MLRNEKQNPRPSDSCTELTAISPGNVEPVVVPVVVPVVGLEPTT